MNNVGISIQIPNIPMPLVFLECDNLCNIKIIIVTFLILFWCLWTNKDSLFIIHKLFINYKGNSSFLPTFSIWSNSCYINDFFSFLKCLKLVWLISVFFFLNVSFIYLFLLFRCVQIHIEFDSSFFSFHSFKALFVLPFLVH